MKKFDTYEKDRMRGLCVNIVLYVFLPGGDYLRPSALRFKRNGEVWGHDPGEGWRNLSGAKATGPHPSDRWQF